MFQDAGEELAAFEKQFSISLPTALIERVWPYAEGLLSTTRKVGLAEGRSVWWLTLLKLRLPKSCDWDSYHLSCKNEAISVIKNPLHHDLIPVYLETYGSKFFAEPKHLRFFPFGVANRFMKPNGEYGFLCFDVTANYEIWYLPVELNEPHFLAQSFDEMMAFPQRKKK